MKIAKFEQDCICQGTQSYNPVTGPNNKMQGGRFDVEIPDGGSLPVMVCYKCEQPYKVLNANEFIMPISHGHILSVIAIAQICYGAYQAMCYVMNKEGDNPDWVDADEDVKKKFINGVVLYLGDPVKSSDEITLFPEIKNEFEQSCYDKLIESVIRGLEQVYFGKENNQDLVFDYGVNLTDAEMAEIRKINVIPFLLWDKDQEKYGDVPHKMWASRSEPIDLLDGAKRIEVSFKPYTELEIIPFRHTKWLELDETRLRTLLDDFRKLMLVKSFKMPE